MEIGQDTFGTYYAQLVKRLMRPLGKRDGVPETEIASAEQRLGFPLPGILHKFYRLTGCREDINGVFDTLTLPESLFVQDNKLVFYEENQGAWNTTVLMRDGQALFIAGSEPEPEIFGGAKSKRKFLELERTFQVTWGYCTLDDE